jgi:integrase
MAELVDDLKTKYTGIRGKRLAVGVLLAAVIGARPMELHKLKGDDVRLRGKLLWARIRGVKKTMRSPRDAIGNLVLTEIRQILFDMLSKEFEELSPSVKARVCDYDSSSLRQFRDAINAAVQRVAKNLFGESEGFRFYTLRRMCAILGLEGLIGEAESSNYFDILGTLARNGGHSLPEFLGGYVGTSVLVIQPIYRMET